MSVLRFFGGLDFDDGVGEHELDLFEEVALEFDRLVVSVFVASLEFFVKFDEGGVECEV